VASILLKKQANATIVDPPADYGAVFIDTDGVPKYKDESGVVHTFGVGDFYGPASAADGHVVVFDGTTGKLGKDGGALGTAASHDVGDFATATQGAKADSALQPNAPITGATKTKITYDADGLVTAGADATTADIADSTNKRYVTDAQLTVIGNTSGTNTGDQTSVTGNAGTATALQTARTIDGQSFDGTVNITVIAPGTHAATSKATPVDADEIPLVDSAASNVLKRLTWANLKATAKAYFDTLYAAISHTHSLSNLTQSSATTNQVPQWNGSAWVPATVSGGSPGGSDKQLQYNNAGAFGGAASAYWDETNGRLSVGAGTSPAGIVHAKAASASGVVSIFQGTTSQTGNLAEWQDSAGTAVASVAANGTTTSAYGFAAPKTNTRGYTFGGDANYGLFYAFGGWLTMRCGSGLEWRFYSNGTISGYAGDVKLTSGSSSAVNTASVSGNNVNVVGSTAGHGIVSGGNHSNGNMGGEARVLGGNSNGTNIAGSNVIIQSGVGTGAGTPGLIKIQTTTAGASGATQQTVRDVANYDGNTTSGESPFLLLDLTSGTLKRVSFGANDSGGTGYKLLRVAN